MTVDGGVAGSVEVRCEGILRVDLGDGTAEQQCDENVFATRTYHEEHSEEMYAVRAQNAT
jgi:hypothetical protein